MFTEWLFAVLFILAVARITRVITADVITDRLRIHVARHYGADSDFTYFLSCPWCVSIWLSFAAGAVYVPVMGMSWWTLPVLALAASHVTGLLSALDTDDVDIVDD